MASVPKEVDQATVAFRRLLGEAGTGEQTRVDALVVLSQRTIFAATWPGQNQAVRTLTNREGETAMPVFTGRDVLDETARRFGWLNPDGSLSFRELGAREALRHALGRGVQFVVVDIGSDHAVEFARPEIEALVQLQNQSGSTGSGAFAAAGEPEAAILDAVRRTTRPPPPAAPPPTPTGRPGSALGSPVDIDMPFAQLKSRAGRAVSQPMPPNRAVSQPIAPARAVSQPMTPPARAVSQPMNAAARAASQQNMPRARPASQPMTILEGRAANPNPPSSKSSSATLAEARIPAAAVGGGFERAKQTSSAPPAGPPGQKAAAMEMAAALASAARAAGDPEAQKAAEEMTRLLMQQAATDTQDERSDQEESAAASKRMAALLMGQAPSEDRESGEHEKELSPLAEPLPDTLLQAISGSLRGFPEVEWALALSDGSPLPVIAVRVDPSFLNRVAEISEAVFGAGEKQGHELQVMLLKTPELVKSARKHGKPFYPWKR